MKRDTWVRFPSRGKRFDTKALPKLRCFMELVPNLRRAFSAPEVDGDRKGICLGLLEFLVPRIFKGVSAMKASVVCLNRKSGKFQSFFVSLLAGLFSLGFFPLLVGGEVWLKVEQVGNTNKVIVVGSWDEAGVLGWTWNLCHNPKEVSIGSCAEEIQPWSPCAPGACANIGCVLKILRTPVPKAKALNLM